jgi:hypothetical protein
MASAVDVPGEARWYERLVKTSKRKLTYPQGPRYLDGSTLGIIEAYRPGNDESGESSWGKYDG